MWSKNRVLTKKKKNISSALKDETMHTYTYVYLDKYVSMWIIVCPSQMNVNLQLNANAKSECQHENVLWLGLILLVFSFISASPFHFCLFFFLFTRFVAVRWWLVCMVYLVSVAASVHNVSPSWRIVCLLFVYASQLDLGGKREEMGAKGKKGSKGE